MRVKEQFLVFHSLELLLCPGTYKPVLSYLSYCISSSFGNCPIIDYVIRIPELIPSLDPIICWVFFYLLPNKEQQTRNPSAPQPQPKFHSPNTDVICFLFQFPILPPALSAIPLSFIFNTYAISFKSWSSHLGMTLVLRSYCTAKQIYLC